MMDERHRAAVEELLRRIAAAAKAAHLYATGHPIVGRTMDELAELVERLLAEQPDIVIGVVDGELVVDGEAGFYGPGASDVQARFTAGGAERVAFGRGVTGREIGDFIRRLPSSFLRRGSGSDGATMDGTEHIKVTRLRVQRRGDVTTTGVAAVRDAYAGAVSRAENLWMQAVADGEPDPAVAADIVEGLAQLVDQNRGAIVALTALCDYDNYTFTHMVNVGVLTMAQARCLGIEGHALRQFGLAGLMHDIGKLHVPHEILTKPDKLTAAEFAIMREHPVIGADILRRQTEMPPLVASVAFEHHLSTDGTGYPSGVRRPTLNLATQLCAIADLFDAMRSKRPYQRAFPTERILAVLEQNDGARFDPRLVRRFSQLMGIYPPGTLVRLDDGSLAVVLRPHAPDPPKPAVRVIRGPNDLPLDPPVDLALWEDVAGTRPMPRIVTPVHAASLGIDPLPYLDGPPAP